MKAVNSSHLYCLINYNTMSSIKALEAFESLSFKDDFSGSSGMPTYLTSSCDGTSDGKSSWAALVAAKSSTSSSAMGGTIAHDVYDGSRRSDVKTPSDDGGIFGTSALPLRTITCSSTRRTKPILSGKASAHHCKPTQVPSSGDPEIPGLRRPSSSQLDKPRPLAGLHAQCRRIVNNAHADDIHGLLRMNGGRFLSGSKDGHIFMWDMEGNLVDTLQHQTRRDYTKWLTAMCPYSCRRNAFAYATRDGQLQVMDASTGETILRRHNVASPPPSSGIKCKARNSNRITCLKMDSFNNQLFVGSPTGFAIVDGITGATLESQKTSQNDWVYCIEPLGRDFSSILVVTGTNLHIWSKASNNGDLPCGAGKQSRKRSPSSNPSAWECKAHLVRENDSPAAAAFQARIKCQNGSRRRDASLAPARHRPFISAVTKLWGYNNLYGLAVFDGTIRAIDVASGRTVRCWQEHIGRTWAVENIGHGLFATSADDASIKLWDVRCAKSAHTIRNQIGRVSVLMQTSHMQWISGACSDDVSSSDAQLGQLSFWDARWLASSISKPASTSVASQGDARAYE